MSSDDDEVVEVLHVIPAPSASGTRKKKSGKPPSLTEKPPKKHKSGPTTARREQNFIAMYNKAVAKKNETGFSDVRSGTPLYGWLDRQKSQLEEYDKLMEDGGTPLQFDLDARKTSRAMTSDMVKMVRPLVEAFKNRFTHRRLSQGRDSQRHLVSNRQSLLSSIEPESDEAFFDTSGLILDENLPCSNSFNQELYYEFSHFASYRLQIGYARKNRGHFRTGKKWVLLAKQVRLVSVSLYCMDLFCVLTFGFCSLTTTCLCLLYMLRHVRTLIRRP